MPKLLAIPIPVCYSLDMRRTRVEDWPADFIAKLEAFDSRPHSRQGWQQDRVRLNGTTNKSERFPFASLPPDKRLLAQARLDYYIADCKRRGIKLTRFKLASLRGNATRWVTQVYTWKYWKERKERRFMAACVIMLREYQEKQRKLAEMKALPVERRMKVLPI